MDFGNLFSRAWNICWNNKWLFLLGFLAALGSGGGGGSNFRTSFDQGTVPPGVEENIARFVDAALPFLLALSCAGFLIGIALWLLRLTAQAGLIQAASDADEGRSITLRQAFSDGLKYLPRYVGLTLLLYLPLLVLIVIGFVVFFASAGTSLAGFLFAAPGEPSPELQGLAGLALFGILCSCVLLCLALPLALLLMIVYAFAQRSIVVEEYGVIDSIRRAWNVFRENLGESLILAVLYAVISFIYAMIVGAILAPLILLGLAPFFAAMLTGGDVSIPAILTFVVVVILVSLIGAVLNALWTTYRSVNFTLAYRIFTGKALKTTEETFPVP